MTQYSQKSQNIDNRDHFCLFVCFGLNFFACLKRVKTREWTCHGYKYNFNIFTSGGNLSKKYGAKSKQSLLFSLFSVDIVLFYTLLTKDVYFRIFTVNLLCYLKLSETHFFCVRKMWNVKKRRYLIYYNLRDC